MIVTVTLNPSIDKTLRCDNYNSGSINTASVVKTAPGGKGINVSRAIKRLGGSTTSLSIIGGDTGRLIVSGMERENIPLKYVSINDENRMCYAIINGQETVINEIGPSANKNTEEEFMELFCKNIHNDDIVAISGSAMRGIAPEFYGELVTNAKNLSAIVMVDLKGENLRHAVSAIPDIIKINRTEFEGFIGCKIDSQSDLLNMAKELTSFGIKRVIITDGANDVLGCTKENIFTLTLPKVFEQSQVESVWGSGDCVAGGFLYGLSESKTFIEALKLGVACGTANTLIYGAGFINSDDVYRLIEEITINVDETFA